MFRYNVAGSIPALKQEIVKPYISITCNPKILGRDAPCGGISRVSVRVACWSSRKSCIDAVLGDSALEARGDVTTLQ